MSRALAVFHGRFGRATVYQLNRPFNMHTHREGHLIFHVGGTPARIDVCDERRLLKEDTIVAINPWEPHNFVPTDLDNGAIFFVLYVNAECRDLLDNHPAFTRLFLGPVAMSPEDHVADLAAIAQQKEYGSTGDEECAIYRYTGRSKQALSLQTYEK